MIVDKFSVKSIACCGVCRRLLRKGWQEVCVSMCACVRVCTFVCVCACVPVYMCVCVWGGGGGLMYSGGAPV